MKNMAITGPRHCALIDVPDPQIRDNFVRVKIEVAPMCTEFKAYQHGWASDVIGHEAAGTVVEVAQPGKVKVGDRVVVMPMYACGQCDLCFAGDYIHCEQTIDPLAACGSQTGSATYAQYLIKQDWLLVPIPEDITTDQAAMACCGFGPTFGAAQLMRVDAYDNLLVVGLGPVGLGGVINGVLRGARVIGVESNPYRAKLAMELGAETVIDPNDPEALQQIKSLTGGRGADKVIDCTAVPAAQQFAIAAARRKGHVAFVGWGGHIEMDNMVPGGLTLQGVWHWNLRDTPRMLQTIRKAASLIDQLITHRFPLRCAQDAWELQLTGQCGKVLLYPWE